jgi:hypothetical protein
VRAAASAQVAGETWRQELSLRLDHPRESRFRGGGAYSEGDLASARYGLAWRLSGSRRAAFSGGVALRSEGRIPIVSPLNAQAVSRGDVFWWTLSAGSVLGPLGFEAVIGERGVRSFAGPLGGATWMDPGFDFLVPASGGSFRAGARFPIGRVRGGGLMHGIGVNLSWSGDLLP